MNKQKLSSIKRQIDKLKKELQEIEEMRPGSLTDSIKVQRINQMSSVS